MELASGPAKGEIGIRNGDEVAAKIATTSLSLHHSRAARCDTGIPSEFMVTIMDCPHSGPYCLPSARLDHQGRLTPPSMSRVDPVI